ncbi:hypothetical protein RHSIM_Rhsim01G0239600 [Rhododendron simsii]|uniref:Uncharacterized protein n=1 Tax=Rhododendron simsii TaxID=118357 RepID=A0A834HIN7_RHOSS|nr:hypothetical protein RHSIM_Rhsim01G0239600 [Rhododendron simsii]
MKEWLCEYAYSSGLKLEIKEMDMERLLSEMRKMMKFGGSEFSAFNCMVVSHTCGDGEVLGALQMGERKIDRRRFDSFFEAQLGPLSALLESMERQMPSQLKEARIAVECLLGAPFFSSLSCFENWEERDWRSGLVPKIGFDAGG